MHIWFLVSTYNLLTPFLTFKNIVVTKNQLEKAKSESTNKHVIMSVTKIISKLHTFFIHMYAMYLCNSL